ncbi:MAG: ThuA domain-containing protein [Verrucomicrobiales bacterium]|nr:ThuA domain-containing protein [Verrucomicrobiales bacterium]
MKKVIPLFLAVLTALSAFVLARAADDEKKPLKVLLVLGGCCHDYAVQKDILKAGVESRINATVDIEYSADTTTEAKFPIYEKDNWAEGYDVVLHDECSANITDPAYLKRILDAHRAGVPAVNIHCAMHSYRWGNFKEPVEVGGDNAAWYEMIGIQSTGHGPKEPIDITYTDKKHPITQGLADWTTIDEELYNNVQIFDTAHALATGDQIQFPKVKKGQKKDPNAVGKNAQAVVAWTNIYGPNKTKIFSTTIGHFNETVSDDRYLDLVTNGLLWVTDHLNDDGTATEGIRK